MHLKCPHMGNIKFLVVSISVYINQSITYYRMALYGPDVLFFSKVC